MLALLSIIAELKQNVIFAMEEPETALPPHTQKRIVNSVREKSAQALFTSHSPYVLEEFEPAQIKVLKRANGVLTSVPASLPPTIKPKAYKAEFRARFCEAILAKYVLIVEGRTELDAMQAAARTLSQTDPQHFKSLEALGVAVIDARSDTQVAPLGNFFRALGKTVFAVFDKQDEAQLALIKAAVDHPYESHMKGFESLVLQGTNQNAIRRYALNVVADGDWPQHLTPLMPRAESDPAALTSALTQFFSWGKGSGQAADLLASCTGWQEMPEYVARCLYGIFRVVEPAPPAPPATPADAPSA